MRVLVAGGNPLSAIEDAPGSGISTMLGESARLLRDAGHTVLLDFRTHEDALARDRRGFEPWDASAAPPEVAFTMAGWPFPRRPAFPVVAVAWFHPPRLAPRLREAARMALPQPPWKALPAMAHSMATHVRPHLQDVVRYRRSARVVAVTEALAHALADSGRPSTWLPPPVDDSRFAPGLAPTRTDGRLVLGFLGDPDSRQKGFPILAFALARLARERPDLRARVRLLALATRPSEWLDVARRAVDVEIVPRRPRGELPGFYRALDLYVHPARYEEFGFALVEAAACGTPVLAAATHSAVEITGRRDLPAPGDVHALSRALGGWLDDPKAAESSWRARERIVSRHGRAAVTPRFEAVLREVAA